jgi:hypothetical protein
VSIGTLSAKLGGKMIKKMLKVLLVLLMVFGAVVSVLNTVNTELDAQHVLTVTFPEVKYLREIPDCKGDGTGCIDTTNPIQ